MNNIFKGKNGPLMIAEIGGNHEGDFNYAKKLVHLACNTKVDVIKLQVYYPDTLVNEIIDPVRYNHFKKFILTKDQHIELAEICLRNNKKYLASVWDIGAYDWIDMYSNFYKIGSGDLTALTLIDEIIKKKKPIVLSTGLSTFQEIEETVKYIISNNKLYDDPNMLAVLQCTSMYPTEDTDVNLLVIDQFKKSFNYEIGYSHHSFGDLPLLIADLEEDIETLSSFPGHQDGFFRSSAGECFTPLGLIAKYSVSGSW